MSEVTRPASSQQSIRSSKHKRAALPNLNKSLLALAALAMPLAAQAQQIAQNGTRPEVIDITGRAREVFKADTANTKFTKSLLDTPQTVQVISQAMMLEQGSNSLMDALRNTPGITMQLGENGNTSAGDTFQMRGFATANSTFVDGIRDLGAVSRDVFNMEQVEVAKGPAGADVGRGAASGYINLISKQPTRNAQTMVSASYGTADKIRFTVDTGDSFGESGAFRINALVTDGGVPKRDEVSNQNYSLAPSIAFGLGTSTRYYLLSQHIRQDNTPDGGIPALGRAGYTVLPYYNTTTNGVTTTTENDATRRLAAAINSAPALDRSNFYGYTGDNEDVVADMLTFKVEHDFGDNTVVRNISRAGKTNMERTLTGTNSPTVSAATTNPANAAWLNPDDRAAWTYTGSRQGIDRTDDILVNQTSFNSTIAAGEMEHALTGGLEIMFERQKSLTFGTAAATINGVNYPAAVNPPISFYNPDPAVVRSEPYLTGAFTDGDTTTTALYLFDTLTVNPQWLLSAGVRYEDYTTNTDSASVVNNVLTPAAPLQAKDQLFSWKVGAVYKPVSNGSLYVSYATSQTPPGSANFALSAAANNQNNSALDPQETDNAEAGVKWELFDSRLNVSAAVFRTENSKQASFDDLANPVQIGSTLIEGIEVAAVGQLTNFWQISAGITRMEAEVRDQQSNTGVDTTGVRWTPEFAATLWTSYTMDDVTVGGGARYTGDQDRNITVTTAPATGVSQIPSFWVADLMVAYRVTNNLNTRFNLYNITDEEYVTTLNNGGNRLQMGAPRSVWLSAEYSF